MLAAFTSPHILVISTIEFFLWFFSLFFSFVFFLFFFIEPAPCYVQATVETVLSINSSKEQGDILAFLTGQEEVERAVSLLNQHADLIETQRKKELFTVLPMYGSLPNHDQLKVFRPAPQGHRKVVIATNIAETSVTIPGIVFGKNSPLN